MKLIEQNYYTITIDMKEAYYSVLTTSHEL